MQRWASTLTSSQRLRTIDTKAMHNDVGSVALNFGNLSVLPVAQGGKKPEKASKALPSDKMVTLSDGGPCRFCDEYLWGKQLKCS